MDDDTKTYARDALADCTKMLEGLSEAANVHDGEPQDGDLTVNRGLFRLLDAARACLVDQMRATPSYRVGKHPIPGLFPIAARAWDFGVRALSGDFSPSAFRAVISDLVGELQQAEEAAHDDLDRAGYDDPPPALPPADQAALDAVLGAANACDAAAPTVAEAAAATCDAADFTTKAEAHAAFLGARQKTDLAYSWEMACYRRVQELTE
jgi:hypothetical protein